MCKKKQDVKYDYYDLLVDNSPKPYEEYAESAAILEKQIQSDNVANIAIVAKYGAGKSSLLATYLQKYRCKETFWQKVYKKLGGEKQVDTSRKNKYVRVSLATFNNTELDETAIERSILQQLLYSRKKEKFPNSKIQRTNKTSRWRTALCAIIFAVFLASLALLGLEFSEYNLFNWTYAKYTILGVAILSLVMIVYLFLYYHKLKKVKYKDLEADLGDEGNNSVYTGSLINRFIDEVLYFFECTNVDLIIFEDLDRLESTEIFVKLRELNTIINNTNKKSGKITFLYAVKDDIFKTEEERAKFFEFILPIVPVINPVTTYAEISNRINVLCDKYPEMGLRSNFAKGVSLYIPDMRILNNTFNDYIVMYRKIMKDTKAADYLDNCKLFALCLYKNLFPYDYALLERNEGLIPSVINMDSLHSKLLSECENGVKELRQRIENTKQESLSSFDELKVVLIDHMRSKSYTYSSSTLNIDSLKTFEGMNYTNLSHPSNPSYLIAHNNDEIEILDRNGVRYVERERRIRDKEKGALETLVKSIAELETKIAELSNYTLSRIIDENGVEFCFNESILDEYQCSLKGIFSKTDYLLKAISKMTKVSKEDLEDIANKYQTVFESTFPKDKIELQGQYIRFLLINNYIDEHYLEYVSSYSVNSLNVSDIRIAQKVQSGQTQFDETIENLQELHKWLNEQDYSNESIVMREILLKIADIEQFSKREKDCKYNNLIELLSNCRKKDIVSKLKGFVRATTIEEQEEFLKRILPCRHDFFAEILESADISSDKKDNAIVVCINNVEDFSLLQNREIITEYLSTHTDYLELLSSSKNEKKVEEFLTTITPKFNNIGTIIAENQLQQYIISNNMYRISVDNLYQITVGNNTIAADAFYNRNYTAIKDNCIAVLHYINNNLNEYVESILLDANISLSNERTEYVCELLKNENINLSSRINLVRKMVCNIEDVSEYDVELLPIIFETGKVKAKWANINFAYEQKGIDCIQQYINHVEEIEDDIKVIFNNETEKTYALLNDIFARCDNKAIEIVAVNLNVELELSKLNLSEISDEALVILLKNKRVKYSDNDFINLIKREIVLEEYIKLYGKNIRTNFNSFFIKILPKQNRTGYYNNVTYVAQDMSHEGIASVLKVHGIDIELKKRLIEQCERIIKIKGYEEIYANYIANENSVPSSILWQFNDCSELIPNEVRIQMLVQCINDIDPTSELDKLKQYITKLDGWENLYDKGEVRIDINEHNTLLKERLDAKKVIRTTKSRNKQYIIRPA